MSDRPRSAFAEMRSLHAFVVATERRATIKRDSPTLRDFPEDRAEWEGERIAAQSIREYIESRYPFHTPDSPAGEEAP